MPFDFSRRASVRARAVRTCPADVSAHAGDFIDRDRHWPKQRDKAPLDVVPQPPSGFCLRRFWAAPYSRGGFALSRVRIAKRRAKRRRATVTSKIEFIPQGLIPRAARNPGSKKPVSGCVTRQALFRQRSR